MAHEYGKEEGLRLFHLVSMHSKKYYPTDCDEQFAQMSAEPENRDRDLLMDLQETRGDVQVAHRPAHGAGTLSKGSGFFYDGLGT